MNYITQYNDLLQRGEIPACRRVKAVYARLAEETRTPGQYVFDEAKADRPITFIERFCRHSKGEWAGQPVRLELFQKAFLQALFGFIAPATGLRRYREAFFLVGRKNGKSPLLAGLALYMLIADGEGGAEVYSTATKYAQARLLFDECHNIGIFGFLLQNHCFQEKINVFVPYNLFCTESLYIVREQANLFLSWETGIALVNDLFESISSSDAVIDRYCLEIVDNPIRVICESESNTSKFRFLPRTNVIYPLFLEQDAVATIEYTASNDSAWCKGELQRVEGDVKGEDEERKIGGIPALQLGSADARYAKKQTMNAQRTADYKNGTYALAGGVVDPLPEDAPQFVKDYYGYYKTRRGYHPRSLNSNGGWNVTSSLSFMNMPILQYAGEIRSAVLLVHGEKAHSRYFSETAYSKLTGDNKELLIIPGANHVDLYDNLAAIPFEKLRSFFAEYLK